MRWSRLLRSSGALPALLLVCGCLQQPWVANRPPAPPTAPRADGKAPALADGKAPVPADGKAPVLPDPRVPFPPPNQDLPPQLRPVVHEEPASRQAAELAQRLADSRDECKVLASRLQDFQAQIDDRTKALAAARTEVRMVTDEVRQTREQIDHWTREVNNLRARAEAAEKENQASVKALTHMVEMMISQETSRAPKPTAPPTPAPSGSGSVIPEH